MKKYVFSFMAAICVVFLSSCGRIGNVTDTAIPSQRNEETVVFGAGGLGESYSVNDYGIIYAKENIIRYYDLEADETYALCDKANCSHSDEKCTAWYSNLADVSGIALYQNDVCLFKKNYDKNLYEFIRMDITGNNQKVVAEIDIGDVKGDSWVLSSFGSIYYFADWAIVEANYVFVENDIDSMQTQSCVQYLMVDISSGKMYEINEKNNNATIYTLLGISKDSLFFQKKVKRIELLSEAEFNEAYNSGEFNELINSATPEERYFDYLNKWYPAHCGQVEEYIKYDLKNQSETLLEETASLVTFDENGYMIGELPKYIVLGNYGQSYLIDEPDWDNGDDELFLWDLEKNQKKSLLKIENGGTLSWETGNVSLNIYLQSKLLYCKYIDDTKAKIFEYDISTDSSRELFEDVRNISFRIINETQDFFIGKIYTPIGYDVYKISKADYFSGNLDKAKKLKL